MSKFNKYLCLISMIFSLSLISGCSLNYEEEGSKSSDAPEFIFTNAKYSRYAKNKLSMQLQASKMEQYKSDNAIFAQEAKFFTWDSNSVLETEGKCYLLSINTNTEVYTLFSDILIQNYPQAVELKAQNLKWNGKTEQLTSSTTETVYLKKDKLEMEGTGFSASGIGQGFKFTGKVTGSMQTEEITAEPEADFSPESEAENSENN